MKKIVWLLILIITAGCKEVYNSPINSPATGYLVVEGFINSGSEPTSIQLSRTTKLYDTVNVIYEHGAAVSIESDGNEHFPLSEGDNGTYVSGSLSLNNSEKYRIHIQTTDGKEYVSDYTTVKSTPVIDSISWQRNNDGVQLFVNTHDDLNATKYYQWNYQETWEFQSTFVSQLKLIVDSNSGALKGIGYRDPVTQAVDESIYTCWQSDKSNNILIGTSEKLSRDLIYLPIAFVPAASWKISVLYSINVNQYALSKEAYQFLDKMKKNTEQLGTVFDAQPSELKGNIHCTSNADEIVIGFVEVSQLQKKRIFISSSQVPQWNYRSGCAPAINVLNNVDTIQKYAAGLWPTVVSKSNAFGGIEMAFFAEPVCIDCTISGTNVKPSFWP